VAFTKIITRYQIYHICIHTLHQSSLFPLPILGIFSIGIIFAFTYMCIQFYTLSTLLPTFPATSPLLLVPYPLIPGPVLASEFSDFVKEKKEERKNKKKKMTFLAFDTHTVSL
jgi:hypothetical protein